MYSTKAQGPLRPPDVAMVVLDTAREDAVDRASLAGASIDGVRQLRRESAVFRRAIAPSTWTYPSHASLLTGLYPWENHALLTEMAPLPAEYPHVARILAGRGYRTVALSANPVVSSWTGLTTPFSISRWSQWWHLFLRIPAWVHPTGADDSGPLPASPRMALPSDLFTLAKRVLLRYPRFAGVTSAIAGRATGGSVEQRESVDPWIEEELRAVLRGTPSDTPLFSFVNLMEAHEPYLPARRISDEGGREVRWVRQDREAFLAGKWTPSPSDLRALRTVYDDGVEITLRRLSGIVGLLQEHGRWQNTVFVLVGDHGQEFCEDGGLFHGTYPGDAQVHVPLWVRFPDGAFGGSQPSSAVSLVDVLPTVLRACGVPSIPPSSGLDLTTLVDHRRPGPVFSHSEQLPDDEGFRMQYGSQWIGLNRFWVAARTEERAIVLDTHRDIAFRAGPGRSPVGPAGRPERLATDEEPALRTSLRPVEAAIGQMLSRGTLASTEERLRSWGYF